MAGWLGKRGPQIGYSWLPRWCVLEGNELAYYEDDMLLKRKGQIPLTKDSVVVAFSSAQNQGDVRSLCHGDVIRHQVSKPYGFALDFNPLAGPKRRVYYFNAGNPLTLRLWIEAIRRCTSREDPQGIPLESW